MTQASIGSTICVRGWTKTIRPPVRFTNSLKAQSIKDYGYPSKISSGYEEDHLIPLELGGAPADVKNLWAEPGVVPNPKDKVENALRQAVCAKKVTLAAAQNAIAFDWFTAVLALGL